MDLFEEQGFEETSAVQIAERARVTTRTFFRYFSDKKEVLFADQDTLRAALVQGIAQAPDVTEPLATVAAVLAGFDWEGLAPRESLRRRDAMIASTPYLLERELIKQHQMADEFASALHQRGVDPEVARLAAHVGVDVFRMAYRQWLEAEDDANLASMTDSVMSLLAGLVSDSASATRGKTSAARRTRPHADLQRRHRARH